MSKAAIYFVVIMIATGPASARGEVECTGTRDPVVEGKVSVSCRDDYLPPLREIELTRSAAEAQRQLGRVPDQFGTGYADEIERASQPLINSLRASADRKDASLFQFAAKACAAPNPVAYVKQTSSLMQLNEYNTRRVFQRCPLKSEKFGASRYLDSFADRITPQSGVTQLTTSQRSEYQQESGTDGVSAAETLYRARQTELAWKETDAELLGVWKALEPQTRQQLLSNQRAWIKYKDTACRKEGTLTAIGAVKQRTATLNCINRETRQRIRVLQNYDYNDEAALDSASLGETP